MRTNKAIIFFAAFLLALPLSAQSVITIAAGIPGDPGVGGYAYSSPAMAALPPPFNHLRAGAAFSYDIPVSSGSCQITLQLLENRAAGPDASTQSAVGSRVFVVYVNGLGVAVDIFASAGSLTPYTLPLAPAVNVDGHLRIHFTAVKGNAVVSGLQITCTPPPVAPLIAPGQGISLTTDPTTQTVTVSTDPALTPRYSAGSGPPAGNCAAGRDLYVDTSGAHLYFCSSTNTWTQAH